MVSAAICVACGTEYPAASALPSACLICEEERQFVPPTGQAWTDQGALAGSHGNTFRQYHPELLEIRTRPHFAIGQRAFLVLSDHGNILWDCLTLLDDATITTVRALGGVAAIAISHPHYYTTMGRWSDAFGAPVYLHAADREWVVNAAGELVFWDGDRRELWPGLTLVRCGGHFAGGTVLHWEDQRGGALFAGDVLQVGPDRRHVSFMRSYPNLMPLSAPVVERIMARIAGLRFERVYGAFAEREIPAGGEEAMRRSAERYIAAVSGRGPADREP